jgi:hypothetical protein
LHAQPYPAAHWTEPAESFPWGCAEGMPLSDAGQAAQPQNAARD